MYIKLPDYIQEKDIGNLVKALADRIAGTVVELDACNLQPTRRAVLLAAEAAVCVLIGHELPQEGR